MEHERLRTNGSIRWSSEGGVVFSIFGNSTELIGAETWGARAGGLGLRGRLGFLPKQRKPIVVVGLGRMQRIGDGVEVESAVDVGG